MSRRGFLLGSAAAGAGAVAAAHAAHIAPALLKGLPEAAAEEAPATAGLAVGLHKRAVDAWSNVHMLASSNAPAAEVRAATEFANAQSTQALKATGELHAVNGGNGTHVDEFHDMMDDPFMRPAEGFSSVIGEANARAEAHSMMAESHIMSENIDEIDREYGREAAAKANVGWGQGENGDIASKVYHPDGPIVVQSFYDPQTGEIVHQHSDFNPAP